MSAADIAAGDDAIYRVSGRRITFTAITIDVLAVVYTLLSATFYFNIIRLTVYHPAMMDPWWTWTPYWRVFGPGVLMFLPVFLYMLVFYKRAALMALYLGMTIVFLLFCGVCFIWLIIDWTDCENQLWCACVKDYTVIAGSLTMTYCDATDPSDPSDPFLVNFFVLLALMILAGVKAGLGTYIHFQYYYRNEAYNANNPYRTLAYNTVQSEMTEEGGSYSAPEKRSKGGKPASPQQPHLHSVAGYAPNKWQ